MLIDTHAHLTDSKFTDVLEVVDRAKKNLVGKIIMPTTSIEDLDRALVLAKKYDCLYVLAGVHPEEIETVYSIENLKNEFRKRIMNNKKLIGIGEIGLDFYWDKEKKTKSKQIEVFQAQMELATELDLPVAIHTREAQEEMTEILRGLNKMPKGQFHCFAGDSEFLKQVIDWGFYVSFAGNITYKSAQNLRDRLKELPLDRLLLETDSPYLSPEPMRGTINEPANVKIIAKFIAEELNQTEEKISEITQKNTLCLYSLDI